MRKILLVLMLLLAVFAPSLARTPSKPGITQEALCLANNVYHEARGESFKGKLAVAMVTINRANSGKYANTICGVVYQKGQFTWTKTKSKITDWYSWTDALLAANMALEDSKIMGNFPATSYHNKTVNPGWKLRKVAIIGNHVFYAS